MPWRLENVCGVFYVLKIKGKRPNQEHAQISKTGFYAFRETFSQSLSLSPLIIKASCQAFYLYRWIRIPFLHLPNILWKSLKELFSQPSIFSLYLYEQSTTGVILNSWEAYLTPCPSEFICMLNIENFSLKKIKVFNNVVWV